MKVTITQLREDLKENLFKVEVEKYYSASMNKDELVIYLTYGELTDLKIEVAKVINNIDRVEK